MFDILDTVNLVHIVLLLSIDDYHNLLLVNKYLYYMLNVDNNKKLYKELLDNNVYIDDTNLDIISYIKYRDIQYLHGATIKYKDNRNNKIAEMIYNKDKLTGSVVYDSLGRITLIYSNYLREDVRIKYKHGKIIFRHHIYAWELDVKNKTLIPYFIRQKTKYAELTTYCSYPNTTIVVTLFDDQIMYNTDRVRHRQMSNFQHITPYLTRITGCLFDTIQAQI